MYRLFSRRYIEDAHDAHNRKWTLAHTHFVSYEGKMNLIPTAVDTQHTQDKSRTPQRVRSHWSTQALSSVSSVLAVSDHMSVQCNTISLDFYPSFYFSIFFFLPLKRWTLYYEVHLVTYSSDLFAQMTFCFKIFLCSKLHEGCINILCFSHVNITPINTTTVTTKCSFVTKNF